jgi:hypothetical protein
VSRRESMSLSQEEYEQLKSRLQYKNRPPHPVSLAMLQISSKSPTTSCPLVGLDAPANKKAGGMNKTELAYSLELEARKQAGEIRWYSFEAMNLRLTGRTYYRPDFLVVTQQMDATGAWREAFQFHEIKGYAAKDDALVKFKVAAELFPFFEFFMLRKRRERDGGGWELMKHLNGGRA